MKPYFIAVANPKGGVAKTTTVASLGGALVKRGHKVLLVDLDQQASLTLCLGQDPSCINKSVIEVLFNSASIMSVSCETTVPGLDLLPSNSKTSTAEQYLPKRIDHETVLRNACVNLPYDYVIMDCPPLIGALTINALVAADLLIIPTQAEYFSVHSLKSMMKTIHQVRSQHNPGLIYRLLITMLDRRNRIHNEICDQIQTVFGTGVYNTNIQIDTKLRESAVKGLPITHFRSQTRSAKEYDALALEIINYVNERETRRSNITDRSSREHSTFIEHA